MENFNENEINRLNKRLDILEKRFQYLSTLLLQVGKEIAIDTGHVTNNKTESKSEETVIASVNKLDLGPEKLDNGQNHIQNAAVSCLKENTGEKKDENCNSLVTEEGQSLKNFFEKFKEKYSTGRGEYDVYLDIAQEINHTLTNYLDWGQVPDSIRSALYLEEARDSRTYYADCEQVRDEFLYFVAPAVPNIKYTQRDFLRLALPYFYDITYSFNLENMILKLIEPAVFLQDDMGRYVLKWKGKIVLAK